MATYRFVPEHNGIEIYFDGKPSSEVRDELKSNGWRWHAVKECWFAKRNADSEKLAKRLCGTAHNRKADVVQTPVFTYGTVSVRQSIGSSYVSTLTISKTSSGFSVASTNNQVICCDCRMFFSVHAPACPFCGCPMTYVAEHYFQQFAPELVRERERLQQEEVQRQQREEERRRDFLIVKYSHKVIKFSTPWEKVKALPISDFELACERIDYLSKRFVMPAFISNDDWYSLMVSDSVLFNRMVERIEDIIRQKDELPTISSTTWSVLKNSSGAEYSTRINQLKQLYRDNLREWQKDNAERVTKYCESHGISAKTREALIAQNVSITDVAARMGLISGLEEKYKHKHLNLKDYIYLTPSEIRKLVDTMVK